MYSYSRPGGKIGKRLRLQRTLEIGNAAPAPANLDFNSTYVYDTEGRMTSVQYPGSGPSWQPVTGPNLGWAFDTMGRLNTMTDLAAQSSIITGATYGPSNELLIMNGLVYETRSYNSMLQLTGVANNAVDMGYVYSSTQNNGKIISQIDAISGETVQYTYDALNRLASATATNGSWGQSYQYDGFGNLTNQNVTAGSAPLYTAGYDANNHAGCEDANGNNTCQVDGAGHGFVYDVENRPITLGSLNPPFRYSYAPGNKRVWRGLFTSGNLTTDEVTFWGVNGQKLAVYQLTYTNLTTPPTQANWVWYASQTGTNYYFGSKLIKNASGYVGTDRLGSIGKFYPWGQEKPSATTNGTEKFTGYFRDSETGLDYAMNRYHNPGTGRFMTPDPSNGSMAATTPLSWNRYSYVLGDPIKFTDSTGLDCDGATLGDDDSDDSCSDIGDNTQGDTGGGGSGGGDTGTDPTASGIASGCAIDGFEVPCSIALLALGSGSALLPGGITIGAGGVVIGEGVCIFFEPCGGIEALGAIIIGLGAIITNAQGDVINKKNWPPCNPPKGTIAYREHKVPPSASHFPFTGDHVHLWIVNQDPSTGRCYWNRFGVTKPPPPAGAIPFTGVISGGTNP